MIWFCPLDPVVRPEVGYGGSPDYMTLFGLASAWHRAASHIDVFKVYPQWVSQATDRDLQIQFANLKRRNIALALEFGVLTESSRCGSGVEGFGGRSLLETARRIRGNGGELRYLAMDEPCFFGTIFSGSNACLWSADQMAANAAENILALLAEFPDVVIGEIEPIPACSQDWLSHYQAGIRALKRIVGVSPAFFHADVNWLSNTFRSDLAGLRAMLAAERVPLGIIYNGNSSDLSDATWLHSAAQHLEEVELHGFAPHDVIFQSWDKFPQRLLPETHAESFTSFIDRYFRRRTEISASLAGNFLKGTIREAAGVPLKNAPLLVSVQPSRSDRTIGRLSYRGPIPSGTESIVFGARVNVESCRSGSAEFLLEGFQFQSDSGEWIGRGFSDGLNGWGVWLGGVTPPVVQTGHHLLHVTVKPGQAMELNSAPYTVRQTGLYHFGVKAWVAPESVGSGYFALIFERANREFYRIELPLHPAPVPLQAIRADMDGRWLLPFGHFSHVYSSVEVAYAGSSKCRPTMANVPILAPGTAAESPAFAEPVAALGSVLVLRSASLDIDVTASRPSRTVLAHTKILFGGIPALMIYPSPSESPTVLPRSITSFREFRPFPLSRRALARCVARPARLLTLSAGVNPLAVGINSDGSLHGIHQPAHVGETLRVFAAGQLFEQTDILLPISDHLSSLFQILIVSRAAAIRDIKSVPGDVPGVVELEIDIPEDIAPGHTLLNLLNLRTGMTSSATLWLANRHTPRNV